MKNFYILLLTGMFFMSFVISSYAESEVEILLRKFVERGIVTQNVANEIKDEIEAEKMLETKHSAQSVESKASVPRWVEYIKIKGDFRLRHEYSRKNSDTDARNRGRIRARVGIEGKISDELKVGIGIATGGTNPRSTNQTLQNAFDSPELNLDYAYAQWKPNEYVKVVGGKFHRKPYHWITTDMLFDGDVRPEGASIHLSGDLVESLVLLDDVDYFVNGGIWILDENGKTDQADPYLKYVQMGIKGKSVFMERDVDYKSAVSFYDFQGIEDTSLDNSSGTNTLTADGNLASSFRTIGFSAEKGVKSLFGGLPFDIDERIAFFGDFIHNFDDDLVKDELTGWAFGMKLGNKKVSAPGSWQLKYVKSVIGRDAWIDSFPDGDRYSGKTNVVGHQVAAKYGIRKNVSFGVTYRHNDIKSGTDDPEDLVQADLILKF